MQIQIPTLHLFGPLDEALIRLLKDLSPEDWKMPTHAKKWIVKDIAAHLLDGNLRTLSAMRDRFSGDAPDPGQVTSYQELVTYLNRLNADWVKAFKRISPVVLVELLEITGKPYIECLKSLDPFAHALFPVDWAGEAISMNWFHIAREFTEKWHHQQQIREAVGQPGIMTRQFYFPVMDTFMRALPRAYGNIEGANNCVVRVIVSGELGGSWNLIKKADGWKLNPDLTTPPETEITLDPVSAWQLFTKGLDPAEAEKRIMTKGNPQLATPLLGMLSVMA